MKRSKFYLLVICIFIFLLTGCKLSEKDRAFDNIKSFYSNEKYEELISECDRALSINASKKLDRYDISVLKYRAEAEFRLKDYKAAKDTYLILKENTKDEHCVLMYICSLILNSDISSAADEFLNLQDEIRDNQIYKRVLFMLTSSLDRDNWTDENKDKFIEIYNSLYSSDKDSHLLTGKSKIFMLSKDYDMAVKAISDADKIIESLYKDNKEDEEYIDLKKDVLLKRALCYEYQLDYMSAKKYLEEYDNMFPGDENIRHELIYLESRLK